MKKSKRFALMLKHKELVSAGKLTVAWVLLKLLKKHCISLGYDDAAFEAECICEKLGCNISYSGPYCIANVYDWGN